MENLCLETKLGAVRFWQQHMLKETQEMFIALNTRLNQRKSNVNCDLLEDSHN